jgi:uncharacterized protein
VSEERDVESPCNRVCTIDQVTGYCIGCLRTLDEISRWHAMSNAERARLVASLGQRKVGEPGKPGGV